MRRSIKISVILLLGISLVAILNSMNIIVAINNNNIEQPSTNKPSRWYEENKRAISYVKEHLKEILSALINNEEFKKLTKGYEWKLVNFGKNPVIGIYRNRDETIVGYELIIMLYNGKTKKAEAIMSIYLDTNLNIVQIQKFPYITTNLPIPSPP